MPRTNLILPLGALALLAGCTVGPNYQKPAPALPSGFLRADGTTAVPEPLDQWWTVFHDQELQSLIERALKNNRDLKVALSRVREARAEREIVAGALIPELDATAGYNRSYGSKNVSIPLGGNSSSSGGNSKSTSSTSSDGISQALDPSSGLASGGSSPAAGPSSGQAGGPASPFGEGGLPGVTTNLFQVGFDSVWEIDIFGGTRRSIQAADATAAVAVESERGVRISLLAEVAMEYMTLRADQAREALARRNLATERQTWKIAVDKFEAGVGNEAQAAQAAALAKGTEATLPPIVAMERVSRHALAFLIGEDPEALEAELTESAPLPDLPPEIPLGVPSDLLRRRPDIRQAERQLQVAYANVGVASAELFPQFSITGALGLDSSTLKQLPEWNSHYYSIAPGIRWPILDWNRLHAGIRAENEVEAQALLSYQSAVAQALKDVEDALVKYESEKARRTSLVEQVTQSRKAQTIAWQTFDQGLADQVAALEAERTALQAEDQLAQSDASLRTDLVSLYKALGGGWQAPERD